jgi:hypothetical protein
VGCGCAFVLRGDMLYYLLYPARQSIVVCSKDKHETAVFRKIDSMKERHKIAMLITEAHSLDEIKRCMEPYSTVFMGDISRELRLELTEHCFEHNKRLFVLPTVEDIIFITQAKRLLAIRWCISAETHTFSPNSCD